MSDGAVKRIDLALQGGGSHGALTWGVLDRLLEDERIAISAISGTSAGAMNAAVLADGLVRGGRAGAREALQAFWQAVSDAAKFSPIQRTIWDRLSGNWSLDRSPSYLFFEHFTRTFSPYEWNPLDINPLRDLLAAQVDFDRVNRCTDTKVFVTATNVRTGRARIFAQPQLGVDQIMASACLPFMFKAVEIDGEAYWDGGYIGNPALYPLVDDRTTRDLVVVQINPLVREELPTTGRAILNRLNEITFNSSLLKELRAIELLHELLEAESLESERYRNMFVHLIHAHEELQHLDSSSKLNAEWEYLLYLKERGRGWADDFLRKHYDDIGERGTLDIRKLFADSFQPPHLDDGATRTDDAAE
ncbi:MAG: patatin-like phospholipase family protein [Alphaproteobacteria bacterium]|jgi:NTE family protein|nr:patatin-like phospholipase family protein [Alphaproteobacteria bacterium]